GVGHRLHSLLPDPRLAFAGPVARRGRLWTRDRRQRNSMSQHPRSTSPEAPPSRKRIWLLLLLVLLLLGGIGGAVLLNSGGGEADPDNKDSSKDAPYSFGPRSHCSDDADPKIYEPLEFGEPIAVRFDRRLLDALDPKNI